MSRSLTRPADRSYPSSRGRSAVHRGVRIPVAQQASLPCEIPQSGAADPSQGNIKLSARDCSRLECHLLLIHSAILSLYPLSACSHATTGSVSLAAYRNDFMHLGIQLCAACNLHIVHPVHTSTAEKHKGASTFVLHVKCGEIRPSVSRRAVHCVAYALCVHVYAFMFSRTPQWCTPHSRGTCRNRRGRGGGGGYRGREGELCDGDSWDSGAFT